MKLVPLLLALVMSSSAWAAGVKTHFMDHSSGLLIDEDTAKAVMGEVVPDKVWKIYPASKYVFLSQVEGGVSSDKTCVVTARVMVLPLTAAVRAVLFRPQKTATAYEAKAGSSTEECRALAKDKLKEATTAVVSSIVKS
jgi:hypothetical protein